MSSPWVASVLAGFIVLPSAARSAEPSPSRPDAARPSAQGQGPEQQDAEARKKLEAEIAKELGQGGAKTAAPAGEGAAAQGRPASAAAAQAGAGGNPMARLLLLPDISAIGSFATAYDGYDVERRSPREGPFGPKDRPAFRFEEVELGLQSVIDPYARADIFVSFTPGGVDVEEAYLTTLDLPAGLQVKAGKFFSPFGRQNQQHPHVWDFVDAPLARGRLLAGETLSGTGVDLAWLAPLPWFAELQLAAQNTAPTAADADRLTGFARLLQYFPVAEGTTLGLGLSGARRSEGTGAFRDLGAVDLYVRARPLASRGYVTLQAELYTRRFRNVEGESGTGGYAQLFVRKGAYHGYGIRYDRAPAAGEAAPGTEERFGALGIWYPSEFQRIRLQLSYDRAPDGRDGLEALLALEFGIGSHGAHPF
ncbi:MAG TPA: hypothetical protein VIW03_10755 [Anaeromyxobacter sp.]